MNHDTRFSVFKNRLSTSRDSISPAVPPTPRGTTDFGSFWSEPAYSFPLDLNRKGQTAVVVISHTSHVNFPYFSIFFGLDSDLARCKFQNSSKNKSPTHQLDSLSVLWTLTLHPSLRWVQRAPQIIASIAKERGAECGGGQPRSRFIEQLL